jgi:uncharacterized protein YgbK (DUF1537 family)
MGNPIFRRDLFLSYYGDDFTGSTDVMEMLALNGIPAALFLNAPEKHEVDTFQLKVGVGTTDESKSIQAFGVAGISRSLTPGAMDQELPAIFEKISAIPTDFFHYKICSTFDSAVETGNIGYAVELARQFFPSNYVPLIVGAPLLNRFVVFGNLFARVHQTTYRLDRHPTMSKHPVTPMRESDLRQHLSLQTSRQIKLMDQFALEGQYGDPRQYLKNLAISSGTFVLFDTLNEAHLKTIGELLMTGHQSDGHLLVGSSGVEFALALYLQHQGAISKVAQITNPGIASNMVVAAGSAAPGTADQIRHMQSLGHPTIRMDTLKLAADSGKGQVIETMVNAALIALEKQQVPVIYAALGPDDPAIVNTQMHLENRGLNHKETGRIIAETQGHIIKEIIDRSGQLRVVVAGGDTSGYVSRVLGIYALETLCPIAPGAPLCVAHSKNPKFDGLEIALKGGQNGNHRYFESILTGKSLN